MIFLIKNYIYLFFPDKTQLLDEEEPTSVEQENTKLPENTPTQENGSQSIQTKIKENNPNNTTDISQSSPLKYVVPDGINTSVVQISGHSPISVNSNQDPNSDASGQFIVFISYPSRFWILLIFSLLACLQVNFFFLH